MTASVSLSAEQRKQSRNTGVSLIVLGVIAAVFFTRDGGTAGFDLTESFTLDLPSQRFAQILAVALVGAGAFQLYRGYGRLMNVFLSVGTALFVMSFLAWSASGESFNFTGMLQDTVARSVPITLGAIAGILCERSGVINIAIEGQLLLAAFTGSVVGSVLNPWLGIVGAVASGVALGGLLGVLAIKFQVDQVIVGFAINFLSLGVTSFVGQRVLAKNQEYNYLTPFRPIHVPLLSDIPVIGPALFEQNLFVYFSYVIVAATTWWMFRTRWGLRTRAIGEYPKAAGSLGVDVLKLRYRNLLIGGAVAGLGGAWWPVGAVGRFDENITGGRGFIALAAVIFGRWHPIGAIVAALVFTLAEAVRLKLGNLDTGIPSEFLLSAPYIVTLVVVAGFVGRSRAPKSVGQPYSEQ